MSKIDDLRKLVAQIADIPEASVRPESSFKDDLGIDSLGMVELAMLLEDNFQITIPDDVAEKMKTVQDAIDYLKKEGKLE